MYTWQAATASGLFPILSVPFFPLHREQWQLREMIAFHAAAIAAYGIKHHVNNFVSGRSSR